MVYSGTTHVTKSRELLLLRTREHAALVPLWGNCKSAKATLQFLELQEIELLEVVHTSSIEPPQGLLECVMPSRKCNSRRSPQPHDGTVDCKRQIVITHPRPHRLQD
jgi:hypothetical protein